MGFFKKMVVDLKEQERLKKDSFIYELYLQNIKERENWKDQPQSLEEFIEGNDQIIKLYRLEKRRGKYE